MTAPSNDELKSEVEAVFGVRMTDDEIEAGKGRLPTMLANARLLADWGKHLGTTGPAQIQQVVESPEQGADDHGQ
jgi:hypothetical protein